MKRIMLLLLLLTLITPLATAISDVHEIPEGRITVTYPEKVAQNTEAEITITIELTENSIRELSFPLTGETINCLPKNCQTTIKVPVGTAPVTIIMTTELEEGRETAIPEPIDEGEEFFFLELGTSQTLAYIKYFTILPEEPDEVIVEQSSPYLDALILDLVPEKTDIVLTKAEFTEQKELASQHLSITKKAKFKILETEDDKKVRTEWTITLEPLDAEVVKGVRVFEEIDKDAAQTTNDIADASDKFIVLKDDPLVMWEFDEIDDKREIKYETDAASLTGAATVVTAEEVQKVSLLQFLLPVLIIPIIAGIIIYISRKREG